MTLQRMNEPFRPVQNEPHILSQPYSSGSSHATTSMTATSGRYTDPAQDLTARACADHIIRLFSSPRYPPSAPPSRWQHHLSAYISGVLERAYRVGMADSAGTCESIALAAMTLLSRYKTLKPYSVAHNTYAYQLFIASFIIAAKEVGTQRQDSDVGRSWAYVASEPNGSVKFTNEELAELESALRSALHGDVSINVAAAVRMKRSISRRRRSPSVDGARQNHVRSQEIREDDGNLGVSTCQDYYLNSREQVCIGVNVSNERHPRETKDVPPPPYEDAARDLRIVETGAIGGPHTLSNPTNSRRYQTQIPVHRSSPNLRVIGFGQSRQSLPPMASAGVTDESEEDRMALARMFVAEPRPGPSMLSPLATIKQKIGGEGASNGTLVGAVKKRVARIVLPRQMVSRPGVTRRRSNTA